ncbi:TIR domain-containing protein [Cryptosporangium sp. NPDC051539]|uniref:TIR domain-containing protein n=1 Tax=Cryptosporangium sp. NPDC051539 TaxID=3363962 RepID=UPI00379A575E
MGDGRGVEADFFVSYTAVDEAWAEWIAHVLEEAGYRVLIQVWDMVPGTSWLALVDQAIKTSHRVIAVLSQAYLDRSPGSAASAEWQAALRPDLLTPNRSVVPVRIGEVTDRGLLPGIVAIDLCGLPEREAEQVLLTGVEAAIHGRTKPPTRPPFPGSGTSLPTGPRMAELSSGVLELSRALDRAARGQEHAALDADAIIVRAVERVTSSAPETTGQQLREHLARRGLDPRILLSDLREHIPACELWSTHWPTGPQVGQVVLERLRTALAAALLEIPPAAGRSEDASRALSELIVGSIDHRQHWRDTLRDDLAATLDPPVSGVLDAVHEPNGSIRVEPHLVVADAYTPGYQWPEAGDAARRRAWRGRSMLPPRPAFWVGRDALVANLADRLRETRRTFGVAMLWLSGMPGAGTSALATEVARAVADDFPGEVYRIDLLGSTEADSSTPTWRLRDAADELAHALGLTLSGASDDDERFALLLDYIATERVLVVFDHVNDAMHVAPMVPANPFSGLVFASRSRGKRPHPANVTGEATPLERADSVRLLALYRGTEPDQIPTESAEMLDRIAFYCGDLPLALELIGGLPGWDPDDPATLGALVADLTDERSRLSHLDEGQQSLLRGVRTSLDISYRALVSSASPRPGNAWVDDNETRQAFRYLGALTGPDFTAEELAAVLGCTVSAAGIILARLYDRCLLRRTLVPDANGSPHPVYSLYELVRIFATEQLESEESPDEIGALQRRHAEYLHSQLAVHNSGERQLDVVLDATPTRFRRALDLADRRGWTDLAYDLATDLRRASAATGDRHEVDALSERILDLKARHEGLGAAADEASRYAEHLARDPGQARQADHSYARAAELARRGGLPRKAAEAEFHRSRLFARQESWSDAASAAAEAARILREDHQYAAALPAVINAANFSRNAGDRSGAAGWGDIAMETARRFPSRLDPDLRASAHFTAASTTQNSHDAVDRYRQAAAIYRADRRSSNSAVCFANAAANAASDQERRELYELEVAAWAEHATEAPRLADALVRLSALAMTAGDHAAATDALNHAHQVLPFTGATSDASALAIEVEIRRLALRLVHHTRPSNLHETLAAINKQIDVAEIADDTFSDVLTTLAAYESNSQPKGNFAARLHEFLRAPTVNPPAPYERWWHEELGPHATTPPALSQ